MAVLRQTATGARSVLEMDHLVGRSSRAVLHLDESYISAQHASIRWVGHRWELRDLGSRNGTFLNGTLVKPGESRPLARHDRVAFGRSEQAWELIDESAPRAMIVSLDEAGSEPLVIEGELLALPSPEDPKATVFRGSDGAWRLEREDEVVELGTQRVFEVGGRWYRFSSPDVVAETANLDWRADASSALSAVELTFRVTRDEEHVELALTLGPRRENLGSRGHNYLLLHLARQRLEDASRHVQPSACGWVYQDDLLRALRITPDKLSIDVFRIRGQFAALSLADAASIVERRPRTKQLRIGVASVHIETI